MIHPHGALYNYTAIEVQNTSKYGRSPASSLQLRLLVTLQKHIRLLYGLNELCYQTCSRYAYNILEDFQLKQGVHWVRRDVEKMIWVQIGQTSRRAILWRSITFRHSAAIHLLSTQPTLSRRLSLSFVIPAAYAARTAWSATVEDTATFSATTCKGILVKINSLSLATQGWGWVN